LQTKSATTLKAIEAVRAEITGIIENPPSEAELKQAKDSILNSFIFHYDSKAKILAQQMTYAFYGLPSDFLEQYRANLEKVASADVARVARQYIHPDQLALLVVGKAADFDEPLAKLGKVTPVDITIPPAPDTAPKAEPSAANLEAGKQAWAKVVKTLGGETLKRTEAIKTSGSLALKMGDQTLALQHNTIIAFPDRVRQVLSGPMGEQTVVINGQEGFVLSGGNVQPLPADALEEQTKEQRRNLLYLLHFYDDPSLQMLAAGGQLLRRDG
jgi:zinc protease